MRPTIAQPSITQLPRSDISSHVPMDTGVLSFNSCLIDTAFIPVEMLTHDDEIVLLSYITCLFFATLQRHWPRTNLALVIRGSEGANTQGFGNMLTRPNWRIKTWDVSFW